MDFKTYILRRIVGTVVTFFVIASVVFFLFRMVGDPASLFMAPGMDGEQLERIRASFGLDEPLYVQYYRYMVNILTLDFGVSFYYRSDVAPVVFERMLNSLFLTIPAITIAYVGGILGGVYMAWNRGERSETFGLLAATAFRSTPRFWLGILLLFFGAGIFGLFPSFGMVSHNVDATGLAVLLEPDFYHHIILPILSMTFYLMGLPLLLMRTSMLEVINEDFIDVCIAKGIGERDVMYKHAARNAMLPVITAMAVGIAFSFGGNVLVETVFSYPGVGRLMVDSVFRSDYPVAQFAFLLMAAAVLTMNLIADLAYSYLDPRVSLE